MKGQVTFATAYVIDDNYLYIAAKADDLDEFAHFTRIYQWYEHAAPNEWLYHDVEWCTACVTVFVPIEGDSWWPCTLSEEGHVEFMDGPRSFVEKIPGAGVYCDDAQGLGYLSELRQIGDHLYAVGDLGQVYKRIAPNNWVHMDNGILQQREIQSGEYRIHTINGLSENSIYIAGYRNEPYHPARASYWNGHKWRDIELPTVAERITFISVESESRIWMCGANGTLLVGNANDGFLSLSTPEDNQLFLSMCRFQGRIYLGSNLGLFVYDPEKHKEGICKVVTGLVPELQDSNIADCGDSVLWSIGPKDIARFNGDRWERIHHPGNNRVGP